MVIACLESLSSPVTLASLHHRCDLRRTLRRHQREFAHFEALANRPPSRSTQERVQTYCQATPPTKSRSVSFSIPIVYSQVAYSSAYIRNALLPPYCPASRACRLITTSLVLTSQLVLQFLGLKGRDSYLEPQIHSAYDDLASTTVEEGYSPRVQDGKIRMLQRAAEELRSKNQQMTDVGVHVEWDDLPGALALLQEVLPSFCTFLALVRS